MLIPTLIIIGKIIFWAWIVIGILTFTLHLYMSRNQFGWGTVIMSLLVGFIPPLTLGFISQLIDFIWGFREN